MCKAARQLCSYFLVTTMVLHQFRKTERVKKENKKDINQPYMINMYNKGMGGVDVCDRLL